MKISDELREWADVHCGEECEEYLGLLADRIDTEMVELPRDADGEVIHVGDEVYTPSGNTANVTSIRLHVMCSFNGGIPTTFFPTDLSHQNNDSFKRIAGDIEAAKEDVIIDHATLDEWADRIRKLAKEEGE